MQKCNHDQARKSEREMEIGSIIKSRREKLNWTQVQLAEKSGVLETQIRRYESGRTRNPGVDQVGRILDALGIDMKGNVTGDPNV